MRISPAIGVTLLVALPLGAGAAAGVAPSSSGIPYCPSLTIVTAVNQQQGDYESIKRLVKVDELGTVVHYSAEQWIPKGPDGRQLKTTQVLHRVRKADEQAATNYLVEWVQKLPYEVPSTTSLGTSRAVLQKLKAGAEVELSIIQDLLPEPSLDSSSLDYVLNGRWPYKIKRDPEPAFVEVLVNGTPTKLPAIRATGNLWDDKVEFYFLDDLDNPMALHFRLGVDKYKEINRLAREDHGENAYPSDDGSRLRVVRISHDCRVGTDGEPKVASAPLPTEGLPMPTKALPMPTEALPMPTGGLDGESGNGAPSEALVQMLERGLDQQGESIDVYDIFFTFDSATIRVDSEPTLAAITALLQRHPDWKLALGGHTDSIADDAYNLTLSKRRAEAVQAALATRGIAAARLLPQGFGESRPRGPNDTLEGRARNRRVELVRQ
ncbi:MAG: OmpA family protein [Deltaproteobacteria bacterium]|nr:OmpA family protein [Deltaproteobacteria bacterium]